MSHESRSILGWLMLIAPISALGVDKSMVPEKWHTPFDLYLTAREAYELKSKHPAQVLLIDVRTPLELRYAGVAEAMDANIPYRIDTLRWRTSTTGKQGTFRRELNFDFEHAVENAVNTKGLTKSSPIIIMCTSSSRAPHAARALHDAGFERVYIQVEGFEGIKAKSGPRKGKREIAGWKYEGLPWSYELQSHKMYFNFAPGADATAQ